MDGAGIVLAPSDQTDGSMTAPPADAADLLKRLISMKRKDSAPHKTAFRSAAIFALLFSGCAGVSNNPWLSSGPHPRVEDCAMIQQATPTRYICDGKVYTSVQLDEISKGEQVQLSQQASHGAFPGNVISPTGNFGTYSRPAAP